MKLNHEKEQEYLRHDIVFVTFCVWSFALLCRPQDYILALKALHPGLVSTIIMLIIFISNYEKINTALLTDSKQIRYFMRFVLVMIIGIPFSMHARESFNMVFFIYVMCVIYFMIFYKVIDTVHKLRTLFFVCCLGCGVFCFFALSMYNGNRLAMGSMFDPNDICFFVVSFLPLNLLFTSKDNSILIRLIFLSIFISGVLVVFLSGSRGGLLALLVIGFFFVIKTKTIKFSHKMLMIIFILIVLAFSPIKYDRFSTMLNLEGDYNVTSETGRLAIWETGVELMMKNPLTGVGVNSFNRAFGYSQAAKGSSNLKWKAAHNSVIQIGTETGFIGLFLFIMMNMNVLKIFNKVLKETTDQKLLEIVSLGKVGFIGMFVSSMFVTFGYSIFFVFYFAFSAVVSNLIEENLNHQVEGVV